ncbi:MAG TPA: AtpZ/AtpI family protein [Pirellulaceae bacterium]|nr:AtpZ/AtpI family protein [Pirellulaceae bacterium]
MNRGFQRRDVRGALARDASRRTRRERGHGSFWRSLSVLGMVGWPIALAASGGALLGRFLDQRLDTGVQLTLMLLTAGTILGSYIAWYTIQQQKQ